MSFVPSAALRKKEFPNIEPWLVAAQSFPLNTDFDFTTGYGAGRGTLDLPSLRKVMKEESAGKRTIQILSDKLLLHGLIQNLGVAQMPLFLSLRGDEPISRNHKDEIERFVRDHLSKDDDQDVVMKPTHLSSGTGVIVISQVAPKYHEATVNYLDHHVKKYMAQTAHADESAALRSLRPGFIVQPKYESVVKFKTPLELRVVTIWGKARLGVWWWGRAKDGGEHTGRNAWLVRHPASPGKLSDNDAWEVVHEHAGTNLGFDCGLKLFHRHMSSMTAAAEKVARAVGAPFLRCDFFVGCPKWGVRLNEVAYGCGADYRTSLHKPVCERASLSGARCGELTRNTVDDSESVARILQEGMARCQIKMAPKIFFERLGVCGRTYSNTVVFEKAFDGDNIESSPDAGVVHRCLSAPLHRSIDGGTIASLGQDEDLAVPEALCRTVSTPAASLSDLGDFTSAIAAPLSMTSLDRKSAFTPGACGNSAKHTQTESSRRDVRQRHSQPQARPNQQPPQQSPRMAQGHLPFQQNFVQQKEVENHSPALVPAQSRNLMVTSKSCTVMFPQQSRYSSWQPHPAPQHQHVPQQPQTSEVVHPRGQSPRPSKAAVHVRPPRLGQLRVSNVVTVCNASPVSGGRASLKRIPVHVPAALSASAPLDRRLFEQSSYIPAVSPRSCTPRASCTVLAAPTSRVQCQRVIYSSLSPRRINC
eukprot:TRINITY_DN3889_c0_g2_i1.p1 TRINITY_DN3889_c0_g2~~TRINITY_DN3889_c0_g2_i1.p1  ORF type:complete len:702 (+),score=99.63 TRINITY_DN3889_c0_g2_i1:71-2176(+)